MGSGSAGTATAPRERLASELSSQASGVAEQVRSQASRAIDRLRERANEQVETQKHGIAEVVNDFGVAVRQAAEALQERGESRSSECAAALADQIESAADHLASSDLSDLMREVRDFARRRPALVAGGLFAVGFLASRFLRASDRSGHDGDEFGRGERLDESMGRAGRYEPYGSGGYGGVGYGNPGYGSRGGYGTEGGEGASSQFASYGSEQP